MTWPFSALFQSAFKSQASYNAFLSVVQTKARIYISLQKSEIDAGNAAVQTLNSFFSSLQSAQSSAGPNSPSQTLISCSGLRTTGLVPEFVNNATAFALISGDRNYDR